jgi:shikimate kinase
MPPKANIALLGFMATGKSTVGKQVAATLGWAFVDIDTLIVEAAGKPITDIFADEGEAGFRRREHDAVKRAAAMTHTVIATGGGVVLDPRNMAALEASSLMVCLSLSAEATFERVRNDTTRPLLQYPNPLARIRELLATRTPYYEKIPHQINRDALSPEQTAARIIEIYTSLA